MVVCLEDIIDTTSPDFKTKSPVGIVTSLSLSIAHIRTPANIRDDKSFICTLSRTESLGILKRIISARPFENRSTSIAFGKHKIREISVAEINSGLIIMDNPNSS